MRQQVLQRTHEAMKELGPLCEAAMRESRIAKGLNRALEAIREGQWDRVELEKHMHISDQRMQRLFSDRGVRSYIRLVLKAQEQQPPRLPLAAPQEKPQLWSIENLIEELTRGPQVSDLVVWIRERCQELGPDATFNLLRRIIVAQPEMAHPTGEFSTYDVGSLVVDAVNGIGEGNNEHNSALIDGGRFAETAGRGIPAIAYRPPHLRRRRRVYRDLENDEERYELVLAGVGHELVHHAQGFYYLKGGPALTSKRLQAITFFLLVLFQDLEEHKAQTTPGDGYRP